MNVQIKTPFGEMSFDIPQADVLALLDMAMKSPRAVMDEVKPAWTPAPEPLTKADPDPIPSEYIAAENPTLAPVKREAPRSRAETMFGSKEGWNMPAAGKGNRTPGEMYTGFLHIRCDECGEVKSFCAKVPTNAHRCSCGYHTDLKDLRVAHVRCKCGRTYTYRTNIKNDFTIPCAGCGSPVDMELGVKGTAFVTVGQTFSGGGTKK